jgi:hypothetical protein
MTVIEFGKNHPDIDKVLYAKQFVSTDKTRPALNNLFVQKVENDTFMVGCDGRKLAKVKLNCEVPEGLYSIVKATKSCVILVENGDDLLYPKYEQVIPDKTYCKSFYVDGSLSICYIAAKFDAYIDFENNLPKGIKGTMFVNDGRMPVLIEDDWSCTVLMPTTMNYSEIHQVKTN